MGRSPGPSRPALRRARTARRHAGLAVVAGLALVAFGCGGDEAAAPEVPTTLSGAAGISTPPGGPCISRVPGQPLSEAEALVRFSATGVCPSYVTVTAGTKVRWTNDHGDAVTVTMQAAGPAPSSVTEAFSGTNPATGGEVVFQEEVAAGETFTHTMDTAGSYYYRLDLIPTFLGTVEVK